MVPAEYDATQKRDSNALLASVARSRGDDSVSAVTAAVHPGNSGSLTVL